MSGRTVVLGGTGYLGAAAARRLRRTRSVSTVSRRAADASGHLVADVLDPAQLAAAVAGADVVVCTTSHVTAATQWRVADEDLRARRLTVDSVVELVRLLEHSPGTTRPLLVHAGTTAVHGLGPLRGYARNKSDADEVLAEAAGRGRIRAVSLQFSTVFGVGAAGSVGAGVVASWSRRAVRGEPLHIWDEGLVERDLLHVEDAARAIEAAVVSGTELAPAYPIGSGAGRSLRWIAERVATAAESAATRAAVVSVPAPEHAAASDRHDVVADPSAFTAATGWSALRDTGRGIDEVVARVALESTAARASHREKETG